MDAVHVGLTTVILGVTAPAIDRALANVAVPPPVMLPPLQLYAPFEVMVTPEVI